ncbi:hypothetical protein ACGFNU_27155 [Spirillospora sp. NPDC048911]|uniref:hypothetical protein n=1 Tax=Spirillospora sp. NPDC048911 TaxID=3364527 RepID=UPI00372267CC
MTTPIKTIEETPWIADMLAAVFDFDVTDPSHTPIEPLHLAGGGRLDPIARDGAGGTYYLCGDGDERPVLYADSEGGAALLAPSLAAALAIIIQLPFWRDCLGPDDLEKIRASIPALEQEYLDEEPDLSLHRTRLLDALNLTPGDALPLLLATARGAGPEYAVLNEDGDPYESLCE